MLMRFLVTALCLALWGDGLGAATNRSGLPATSPHLFEAAWPARWIKHPEAPQDEFGVYFFRKRIELAERPARYVVHVTADARYRLFVNGRSVCFGPQRSDSWIWHYESVDLAPWLQSGVNVIAAQVVGYGEYTPYSVVGKRTSFLMQGDTDAEAAVNTGEGWKTARGEGYAPLLQPHMQRYFYVVGPGTILDGAAHAWDWLTAEFDDSHWKEPRVLRQGRPAGLGADIERWLTPRNIPLMEETPQRLSVVRRASGVTPPAGFLEGRAPWVVPAGKSASVLLDQGFETNAFPQLVVSGGRGGRVRMTYGEALYNEERRKGHRDEIEGRSLIGGGDEFRPDGGERRVFAPLDFRTYRYLQLDIEAGEEPLRVDDLYGVFTGYPFEEKGSFASDDETLKKIWEVGWRTARLCAFETYVDCPYYEQLQYVGDTRIQSLISLYVAGDDRLMRNAIEQFDRSRIPEGLTQSRYPSVMAQVINTFSLLWVDLVHDYWMHREDDAFVRARLPGIEAVIGWFERKLDPATGLLGPLNYWSFVDWAGDWRRSPQGGGNGEPPGARRGGSSVVSLQFAGTLDRAAELCGRFDRDDLAARYAKLSRSVKEAVLKSCWDEERRLIADTPEKRDFSQHANTFAVLTGLIEGEAARDLMRRVAYDQSLVQATTYFRFYLLRAMKRAGLGDEYLAQLGPWRTMLSLGLTTFAEQPEPTRSDCHAWSASPVYELLATVAGVEPMSPGFGSVRIAPHLGHLQEVRATVPHPKGTIRVELKREGEKLRGAVTLPEGLEGEFAWKEKRVALRAGAQALVVD